MSPFDHLAVAYTGPDLLDQRALAAARKSGLTLDDADRAMVLRDGPPNLIEEWLKAHPAPVRKVSDVKPAISGIDLDMGRCPTRFDDSWG
jgi:hypothetical protein